MKGLNLRTLRSDLHRVHPDSEKPASTITGWVEKLEHWSKDMVEWFGSGFDFMKEYHRLPLEVLVNFSFDEICKLRHSSIITMHESVDYLFEARAQYEIVRKIESSMWRWSVSKGTWNEVVDAYDNIRHFHFGNDPDFEIRLDFSTGYNEYGYSKYSRTYIDGVFAFLVYYKRKHVMTIGFSILDGRRILIQQVQSAQRSGNRYLYKLQRNRLEFVIDLFAKNFPGYKLYVVDGRSLADKVLRDYRRALEQTEESIGRNRDSADYLKTLLERRDELNRKIEHLLSESERLDRFYRDAGRHALAPKPENFLNILHYPIAA